MKESYQLTWPGKAEAILEADNPTAKQFCICREESTNYDGTDNLFIEGDNLDALKLLRKDYADKIKMIYIDPPYNTGNQFLYFDNFQNGTHDKHSLWLSMMYPRLKISRELLSDNGAIFLSIDNNEYANLKIICDEIFDEKNLIESYMWESNFSPDNSSKFTRKNGQHILCYAKNKSAMSKLRGKKQVTSREYSLTKTKMNESVLVFKKEWTRTHLPDGIYKAGKRDSEYTLLNDIEVKNGVFVNDVTISGRMIWGQKYLENEANNGTRITIKTNGFIPHVKKSGPYMPAPTTIIPKDIVGDNFKARADIKSLFGEALFTYAKPVSLLTYLINTIVNDGDIVLDFFAGSATTAHAILQLNVEDGKNRKFIMVQSPEVCRKTFTANKAGYKNIAEIAKDRIRFAGKQIKNDNGLSALELDTGFRVIKTAD